MNREKIIKNVLQEISEFNAKKDSKFMPMAFGCDVHLADETIENHYHKLDNRLGEQFVRCMYLRLMEEEVWLQESDVKELIGYCQNWLQNTNTQESQS